MNSIKESTFKALTDEPKIKVIDNRLMDYLYDMIRSDISESFKEFAKSDKDGHYKGRIGRHNVIVEWIYGERYLSIDGVSVGTENYLKVIDSDKRMIGVSDGKYIFIGEPDIYDILE